MASNEESIVMSDSVERSIHVFELVGNMRFNDIERTLAYIQSERQKNPDAVLHDVGETTRFLYMSENGIQTYRNKQVLWIKFGWARKSGLPETLDVKQGKTEFLYLPSGRYLYEPAHFIIFEHSNKIVMIQEFNFFGPRATRLCTYLVEFFKKLGNNQRVKLYPRRVFMKDVDKLLRRYTVVKTMRIELEPPALSKLSQAMGGSKTSLDVLTKPRPGKVAITFMSNRGEELEITIDKILELFHEIEDYTTSFKLRVKKVLWEKSVVIDLKKQAIIFRKHFKLARYKEGNVYRSADTEDAIHILLETINDVLNAIE